MTSRALADIAERIRRQREGGLDFAALDTKLPEATQTIRILEAVLFAAAEPLSVEDLSRALPQGSDILALLAELQQAYAPRGMNLIQVAGKWAIRTAPDLAHLMQRAVPEQKRLSRAALETLAIVAYHQPVTRAEVEDVRGVGISRGTLDLLMEIGWIRMRGRRRSPGRPVTYGTTDAFLNHFGLNVITDLPGLMELKGAGLLDANLPPNFDVPLPHSGEELTEDEDPLDSHEPEAALEMDLLETSGDDIRES